ncbi:MAG: tetratricopeptide repeat protein [Spirochaetaceae bacterium]
MKNAYLSTLVSIIGILLLTIGLFFYLGCQKEGSEVSASFLPFIVGDEEQKNELSLLFASLDEKSLSPENRFIIIQEINKILHTENRDTLLNLFLTTYVENHRGDPFNGYYLLIVARNYLEEGAESFAVHYFERILKNHPDLSVDDRSIHFVCLQNLIELEDDPELKVSYYNSLISQYGDRIQKGPTYYHLAKTYEALGKWELAIQSYRNFLNSGNYDVKGVPKAEEHVKEIIDFYDYKDKNWTMESLEDLVDTIKYAIRTRNISLLNRYRAKVNFFAVSWEANKVDANLNFLEGLNTFLNRRIYYSSELDLDSNAQEAYLKTWGWSYRIKTWYLYFRKIHFPSDPDIHGQWEWGGIYFGEKPFAGTQFPN